MHMMRFIRGFGWVIVGLFIAGLFPAIGFRELGVVVGGLFILLAMRVWFYE